MNKHKNQRLSKKSKQNQVVTANFVKKMTEYQLRGHMTAHIIQFPLFARLANGNNKHTTHHEEHCSMEDPKLEHSHHILNNAPMAIITTDDTGLILWCNDTLADWLGCSPDSCLGRTETALLGISEPANSQNHVPDSNGPFTLEQKQKGEQRRIMRCPLPIVDGQKTIFYVDVSEEEYLRSERTHLAQQLEQHNTIESISGLLNERAINNGLEPLLSRSRRYQNPLSVVTMSIMDFEHITSTAGQVAVDKIIVAVSQLLRDQMRWADLVGRLESGQFVFVLPETDKSAAIALANKIASQLNTLSIRIDDQATLQPQACFGVAAWEKGDDIRILLARSSSAVQTAIQNGGSSVEAA
ncbi:MAG: diguanylate cyclase [Ectothiorhodospiraceae bacterium]|nr:diguanylate cyclase [Ectothiorhodospiraceae bacterium]